MSTFAGDALLPNSRFGTAPRFGVEIDGIMVATFAECSGFAATVKSLDYEEGGLNFTTRKFPGRTDFGNLTLKRGMTDSADLYEWFLKVVEGTKCRKNVTIKLMTHDAQTELRAWKLHNAFPVKWSAPSLQVASTAVAIESLELAHQGWDDIT